MEAKLVIGLTRDRDTLESLYVTAVKTYNDSRGSKNVWIILDGIAIQIFSGDDLQSVSKRYEQVVNVIKKGE